MSIIWVLEPATSGRLAAAIRGDHAVRSVASVASLKMLIKLSRRTPPNLILIDLAPLKSAEVRDLTQYVNSPEGRRLRFMAVGTSQQALGLAALPNVITVDPGDSFSLSLAILHQLPGSGDRSSEQNRSGKSTAQGNGLGRRSLKFRDIAFDPFGHQLEIPHSQPEVLTPKEGRLLRMLMENAGQCVTRDHIIQSVWPNTKVTPRTIDTHISRLRSRLRDSEAVIESVYGGGYVLK